MSDLTSPKKGEAGVAGFGAGTGYLGLLSNIPESHHWLRDILVFLAPALTIVFGFVWLLLADWVSRKVLDWQLSAALKKMCAVRDAIEQDPKSTTAAKRNAQTAVEAFRQLQIEAIHEGVAEVRAKLRNLRNGAEV